MTNNEKMIALYGPASLFGEDGLCEDCSHLGDKNRCDVGRIKVNKHMAACGKFEGDPDD